MGVRESVRSWRRSAIDLVWPQRCPVCESWMGGSFPTRGKGEEFAFPPSIHPECLAGLSLAGHAPTSLSAEPASCPVTWCYQDDPRFFRVLHAVKYGGQFPLIEVLSHRFAAWAAPLLDSPPVGRLLSFA